MTKAEYQKEKMINTIESCLVSMRMAKSNATEKWVKDELDTEIERIEYLVDEFKQ